MDILGIQLVNALSYGMLLFIITSGLSLVFGILGVLNLAHGSMYMMGAYLAFSLTTKSLSLPAGLQGSIQVFGQTFPVYRLLVIAIGLAVGICLWLLQEKTRFGAIIRAGLVDKEMVGGLGINIKLVFTSVFLFGGILAGFGGGIAAHILGIYPGMEFQTLILALVVLVIGGLGSFLGTFVASLLVGLLETFSKYFLPEVSLFIIFVLMAVVLVVKPSGLLGKKVG